MTKGMFEEDIYGGIYEEIGTYLDDEDVDNNYISFEKDTPEGLIITNVTNNRVYQIFHDLRGK